MGKTDILPMKGFITFKDLTYQGRLGNQLWRIAWMFGEAERRGFQPVIPADWAYRSIFSIPDEFFGWGFFLDGESKIVDGQRKHYQNHQFFQNVEQKIREYFSPDPRVREWILKSSDEMRSGSFASVHVRRGDYLKHRDFFPMLSSGYYRSAIRDVRERKPGIRFVVFSDDIKWCVENPDNFGWKDGNEVIFSQPLELQPDHPLSGRLPMDHIDLFRMALLCEEHVLANSTYSWWGAFLSRNPAPIYPSTWYGDKLKKVLSSEEYGAFPETWREFPDR